MCCYKGKPGGAAEASLVSVLVKCGRLTLLSTMKSMLVFVVCVSCLHVSSNAFEYNFQITHGPGSSGYGGQGRSSVHFKGPQPVEAAAPGYKDEQAHASEGYQQGYSVVERDHRGQYAAAAHQYPVGQPDDKYKYAIPNQEEEPQTELRYVSQEEASKYQQERGQVVKYVPAEEAHKYQQSARYQPAASPQDGKYQSYPRSQKYESYQSPAHDGQQYQSSYEQQQQHAPQRYEEYSPEPNKYESARPAPQSERYVQYQPVEHDDHHQQQPHSHYRSSEKHYPAPSPVAVEQKIQYVQAEEPQPQYKSQAAPVQYVQQYVRQSQKDEHAHQPSSEAVADYHNKAEYGQSPNYVYAYPSDSVQYSPRQANQLEHQQQPHHTQQPHQHTQEYEPPQSQHERAYPQHFGSEQKFELAGQYKSSPESYKSIEQIRGHHRSRQSVFQSASVPQPSYKQQQQAASADPQLTHIASHGAPAYGRNAVSTTHSESSPHSEEFNGYAHLSSSSDSPQAYHVPQQQYSTVPIAFSKSSQHSFPQHLTHGIARGTQSTGTTSHLQNYYVEKAKKKSS